MSDFDVVPASTLLGATEQLPENLQRWYVPWVLAAAGSYLSQLLGDEAAARAELERWATESHSELWVGRAHLLVHEGIPCGGYVALSGLELHQARKLDALGLLKRRRGDVRLGKFLNATRELFARVPDGSSYLSKIGLMPGYEGRGLGTLLLDHWSCSASRAGATALHLDVEEANSRALRAYQRFGFTQTERHTAPDYGLSYLAMTRSA